MHEVKSKSLLSNCCKDIIPASLINQNGFRVLAMPTAIIDLSPKSDCDDLVLTAPV